MTTRGLKVITISMLFVSLLAGCGEVKTKSSAQIPESCEKTKMISALPADIRSQAKYIPTKWSVLPGTDLEQVIKEKGLACSYGIQNAEIGITVYWTSTDFPIFESRKDGWIKLGMKEATLSNGDRSYVVEDNASLNAEVHSWAIEISHKNVWIHIGATYIYTLKDALPLIDAAINSLN